MDNNRCQTRIHSMQFDSVGQCSISGEVIALTSSYNIIYPSEIKEPRKTVRESENMIWSIGRPVKLGLYFFVIPKFLGEPITYYSFDETLENNKHIVTKESLNGLHNIYKEVMKSIHQQLTPANAFVQEVKFTPLNELQPLVNSNDSVRAHTENPYVSITDIQSIRHLFIYYILGVHTQRKIENNFEKPEQDRKQEVRCSNLESLALLVLGSVLNHHKKIDDETNKEGQRKSPSSNSLPLLDEGLTIVTTHEIILVSKARGVLTLILESIKGWKECFGGVLNSKIERFTFKKIRHESSLSINAIKFLFRRVFAFGYHFFIHCFTKLNRFGAIIDAVVIKGQPQGLHGMTIASRQINQLTQVKVMVKPSLYQLACAWICMPFGVCID
ncbi:hypothetical protein Syun_012077 [Stephania yunnanensis]|uniref:Uncharacterized protein n=1 Tax=Stephania yunnanensis TaxID=152371 RepID=A0AAP0JYV2_9MAGN